MPESLKNVPPKSKKQQNVLEGIKGLLTFSWAMLATLMQIYADTFSRLPTQLCLALKNL